MQKKEIIKAPIIPRIFAFIIDAIILILLFVAGYFLLLGLLKFLGASDMPRGRWLTSGTFISFFPMLFLLLRDGLFQGSSPGKKIMGLQCILFSSKEKCTYKKSIQRNFPMPFLFFMLMLLYHFQIIGGRNLIITLGTLFLSYYVVNLIIIMIDKEGRKFSDKMFGTQITKRPKEKSKT